MLTLQIIQGTAERKDWHKIGFIAVSLKAVWGFCPLRVTTRDIISFQ
jgi:hypothetical protein